jgi:DNA topoisomerase-1
MAKKTGNLVIVESPTKGRTIERFLGPDFYVLASFGHVRDLPRKELGVAVEKDFEPKYVVPPKSRKTISLLKNAIADSEKVYIATDPDREGEAIGWHILEATKTKTDKVNRIVFHEITKKAIEDALKNPRGIDQDLVNAQQARRVLDRLVGYKLSPLLWKKVSPGLSAGRVQSVAVRLIVDREREILAFKPQEYWSVEARLEVPGKKPEFTAILVKIGEKNIEKLDIKTEKEAKKIIDDLSESDWQVLDVKSEDVSKYPFPPFTTSTLQQEGARQLGFSASKTMQVAQRLYERGLITYHRTDSVNLAWSAIALTRKFIEKEYGKKYLPARPRQYKTRSRVAQEAHEAIRPTVIERLPDQIEGKDEEQKLYELIHKRMLACQMSEARLAQTTAVIEVKKETPHLFETKGLRLIFDGFTKLWPIRLDLVDLPALTPATPLNLLNLDKIQHFTEPPYRYNMATLIKTLEEHGIGRPSTYAPIIQTIIFRSYVRTERGTFYPTDLGMVVTDLLKEHFPNVVDIGFTAQLEEDLDEIANGKEEWHKVLADFYTPFAKNLGIKEKELVKSEIVQEKTDKICPESGHPLVIKLGRYGKFLACSGYPKCKYTEPLIISLDITCPECKKGTVIERKTRKGATFYGCSRYPDCKWATWTRPVKENVDTTKVG